MNRTMIFVIFASLTALLLGCWFLSLKLRISPALRRIVLAAQTIFSFSAIYFVCRFLEFSDGLIYGVLFYSGIMILMFLLNTWFCGLCYSAYFMSERGGRKICKDCGQTLKNFLGIKG